MRRAGAGCADAQPAAVLEPRRRSGIDRDRTIDAAGVNDGAAERRRSGADRVAPRRGSNGSGVQQGAISAVQFDAGAAGTSNRNGAVVRDDPIGVAADAGTVCRAGLNDAAIEHIIADPARQRRAIRGVDAQHGVVGDRIVDPRYHCRIPMGNAVRVDIDADGLILVDRIGGGQRRARECIIDPGLAAARADMQHRGMHAAVGSAPVGNQIILAAASGPGDPLEMGEDRSGMIIALPCAGGLVINIATFKSQARRGVAAGDLVRPNPIGRRADGARIVVRGVCAGTRRVDERIARLQPGVVIPDHLIAERAVGDRE